MIDYARRYLEMTQRIKKILPCYYAFFANGMMVLVIGAILPYLIAEARIGYTVAGGLLSAFAIGNLLASLIAPLLISRFEKKTAIRMLSPLIPIFLMVITLVPSVPIMYISFLFVGVGRGSVSIVNNMIATENDASTSEMNLLHTMFAIGAFLAPFLTVLYINGGLNWKYSVYTVAILLTVSSFSYGKLPKQSNKIVVVHNSNIEKTYFKNFDFYVLSFIMFFYLGVENCVNGWFVTYFKSSGIMSDSYATNLVSITWFLIMIGRLSNSFIARKISKQRLILINCICAAIFFLLLISTQNLVVITIAVAGLGFFFAGIYPTCIANAGEFIKGSTMGMSIFLAIAALGGIISPQIVGILADYIGIAGAIGFLIISIVLMCTFAMINLMKHKIVDNE